MSDNTNTETQVAAAAEQALKGALGDIKGLDVKIRVHKAGVDWAEVGELGMKTGIVVVGAAAATAAGFGVARAFGYKPGGSTPAPTP